MRSAPSAVGASRWLALGDGRAAPGAQDAQDNNPPIVPELTKNEPHKIMHFVDVHWWGGEAEGNQAISEIIQKQQERIEKLETKDRKIESENQEIRSVNENQQERLENMEKELQEIKDRLSLK